MNNPLQVLEGKNIYLSQEGGVLSLLSQDGWSLIIYNCTKLLSSTGEEIFSSIGDTKTVASTDLSEKFIFINFDDGSSLRVDLSLDAYTGPEAMQLAGPNGEIIIWS
ncbi:hypothetical protein [Xanthomonas bundabergensis]|uniref:hypothetical protein n=1 Tax=Xanthomonas bundabergensis TaxID=3160842 RepID=UPI003519C935